MSVHPEIAEVIAGTRPWTVVTGDCLEILPTLPDGCVDAVISDVPYGVKYADWDSDLPPQTVLTECLRISRGPVLWFGASPKILDFARYDPRPDRFLVWAPAFTLAKTSASGCFYRWHPIAVWRTDAINGKLSGDVLRHNTEGHQWWNHPATKPVDLMADLIEWAVPSGGSLVDCYAGSGSTIVAAAKCGYSALGIEIDEKYAAIARRRIADAAPLFVPPEPKPSPCLFAETP